MLIERSYLQNVKYVDNGEFEVPGKLESNKSKKAQDSSKAKEPTAEEKVKLLQKKIFKHYDVVLSLNSWLSVKIGLNQPEKVEKDPAVEEAEAAAAAAAAKAAAAKGKKK